MAKCNDVTVDILVDGTSQPIFEDPDPEDNNKEKGNNFYVEAIEDARFSVKITLDSGFGLFGADGVLIYLGLDGPAKWHRYLDKTSLVRFRSTTFESLPVWDSVSDTWENGAFTFAKLRLLESMDAHEAPSRLLDLGKIYVGVKRVFSTLISKPIPVKGLEEKTVTEVTEKLLKGKAIETSIKTIRTGAIPTPVNTKSYTPILGPQGYEIKMSILYRSKKALKSLGCIPRTPSPEPETNHEDEIQSLRARLAVLERASKVKPESSGSVVDLTSAGPSGRLGIKRERHGEAEVIQRKRSRGQLVEVVDLTDD